jgi:peptidoglycan/xylan/chitin deacetylase (PgdA/CDA1 family)
MSRPYLALTFDDGPHVTNTPRLLKILEERNVKATFYVVGRNVREYPALLRRMVAEGHEIGNHSWDHPPLSSLGPDKIRLQLHKTHDAVLKAAGYQMRTMRPPYGATNLRVRQICLQDFGYPAIIWSVDPLDWKQPGAEEVERLIIQGAHPGAIILVHDIHAATVDAMPKAIDELLARGYHFVTVSQLLNLGYKYPPPAPMPEHVPVAIPVEEAAEALPVENLPLAPLRPPVDLPLPGVGTPAPAAGGN